MGHGGCGLCNFGSVGWQWVGFKFDGSWLIVVLVLGVGFESVVLGLGLTLLLSFSYWGLNWWC